MASRLAQATCGRDDEIRQPQIEQNIALLRRLDGQHVEARAANNFVGQRIRQGCFVDEPAAAGVDQQGVILHQPNSRAPIMFLVSGVNGKCRVMMSLSRIKVSRPVRPGCGKTSYASTFMPKASAIRPTDLPIAP